MEKEIEFEKIGFLVILSSHWRGSNGSFKQKKLIVCFGLFHVNPPKLTLHTFAKKAKTNKDIRVSVGMGGGRRIRVNIFFWYVPCNLPGPWYNWVGVGEGNIISNNPFRGVHRIWHTHLPPKKKSEACSEDSFIKKFISVKNSREQNLFGLLFWSFSF